MSRKVRNPEERFRKKCIQNQETDCIEWQGGLHSKKSGYGVFHIAHQNLLAHRYAWEIAHGPIPDGMCVCHTCENKLCVNPDHMMLATAHDFIEYLRENSRGVFGARSKPGNYQNYKLNLDLAKEIRMRRAAGEGCTSLAREFHVSDVTIYQICSGRKWKNSPT
jgi:hypothetical protein